MTVLFDTHAHLDDEQLFENLDVVVQRATVAGVCAIMAVATSAESAARCVDIASRFPKVYASVGIQPNYVAEAQESDWQRIEELANLPVVKAIGETGLDHYWDYAPLALQRDYFARHIELSAQTGLPLIIHMRDARDPKAGSMTCGEDILRLISSRSVEEQITGVMHSFTGDEALMEECVESNLYISFAGMVTYKKSDDLRRVAAAVPKERLLIETDSPYLSPHPKRGQRPNEPALVRHTAECLAETLEMSFAELTALTTRNACRLFGIE